MKFRHFVYRHLRNRHLRFRQVECNLISCQPIPVEVGTHQGGLTSPFVFNLFYADMINKLDNLTCGITINNTNYSVFAYADDILLLSTTPSGLQKLIDIAGEYIVQHGLRFNPSKSHCMISGGNPFTSLPTWSIAGKTLCVTEELSYLGTVLDGAQGNGHIDLRCRLAQKSFYALQNVGVSYQGVSPDTAINIFTATVRNSILYACHSVHLSVRNQQKLDSFQAKLIKAFLGLGKKTYTSQLLEAVRVSPISDSIGVASMDLLRSCLVNDSKSTNFYSFLLSKTKNSKTLEKTLVGRAYMAAQHHSVNLYQYIFNNSYRKQCKHRFNIGVRPGQDGMVDSIRYLLSDYSNEKRLLLSYLLRPF